MKCNFFLISVTNLTLKVLEKRAEQFTYMYVCKICKGQQTMKSPGVVAGNTFNAPISRTYDDPSPADEESQVSLTFQKQEN